MVEEVAPRQVYEWLSDGEDLQVVDVREPEAFRRGHVPGAINVPFPEFPRRIDEVEWGDRVVLACPVGRSSRQAGRLLESYEGVDAGTRVYNLSGGYEEWEYDLEASDPAE